jgi:histidinol-phosphate aminotransferase
LSYIKKELLEITAYQPGKQPEDICQELNLDKIIKLSSNECPYPPPQKAIEAMVKELGELNHYPDNSCRDLKAKLSTRLGISTANITVGNGSNELIGLLCRAIVAKSDQVVMAWPSFIIYPLATKIAGGEPIKVPLANYKHDLGAMRKAISDKTKIVFVCNPNNPTGTIVEENELRSFIQSVPKSVVIAIDEAYFEYVTSSKYLSGSQLFSSYPNLVVFRTFSKIYGLAGARIGYMIASEEIIQAINRIKGPFEVNRIAQVGAFYALDEEKEISRRKKEAIEQRERLVRFLREKEMIFSPSETNFLYMKVSQASSAFEKLKQQGVIVRSFSDNPSYLRITIGSPEETDMLIEVLGKLAAVL